MSFGTDDRSHKFADRRPQLDLDKTATGHNIETDILRWISKVDPQRHQLRTSGWKRGDGREFVNRYAHRNILEAFSQYVLIYFLVIS